MMLSAILSAILFGMALAFMACLHVTEKQQAQIRRLRNRINLLEDRYAVLREAAGRERTKRFGAEVDLEDARGIILWQRDELYNLKHPDYINGGNQ